MRCWPVDALRQSVVTSAARLEHVARVSVGRGLGKVIENQKALESEARQLKQVASSLHSQASSWGVQYKAFVDEVEVCPVFSVCKCVY